MPVRDQTDVRDLILLATGITLIGLSFWTALG
jgi:hypothetical protein